MPFVHHNVISHPDTSHEEELHKKHIKKMPEKLLEKGDPDFVDERKHKDDEKDEKEKSFLESLFGD